MLPNLDRSWDALWDRDGARMVEERGPFEIMDEIKFSYLTPFLPRNGTVMEFGCGSARLLRLACAHGLAAVGLDFSRRALEVAQRAGRGTPNTSQVRFVRGDVTAAPIRSGSVDVVASTGLLEHFADPLPVMREMVRTLKPGGLFYSDIVPAKFSLFRSLDWLRVRQVEVFERAFSGREIRELLCAVGLQGVRVFGAGVFPPRLPFFERFRPVRRAMTSVITHTLPLWKALDDTWFATLAGFYFFALGWKAVEGSAKDSRIVA